MCEGICLNSNAFPKRSKAGKWDQTGNKTECALLEMAYNLGFDYNNYRPCLSNKIKKIIPFSSEKKKMTILYDPTDNNTNFRVYSKGAPDFLLEKCSYYINKQG